MSEAIVFISHFEVKPGGLAAYRRLADAVTRELEMAKPRTAVYLQFLDDRSSRLTIVHAFPDAAAMAAHFEGSEGRSVAAYEYITPLGWEVYGPATDTALAVLRDAADAAAVTLRIAPQYLAGFVRFSSG
ncbi:MAG TPA: hypothetical protein VFH98_00740 [Candidatus Limnocylindria bacterium]|jgi:hypothetical protein|nr:hypothetical protein [Candidatus Limnocylindria bacterium]